MYPLEKLFVTCLIMFGLLILFMFGLYFDLGELVEGWWRRDEPYATGVGQAARMVEEMERLAVPAPVEPRPELRAQLPALPPDVVAAAAGMPAPLSGKDWVEIKRAQLKARGHTHPDYIEMIALAEDREDIEEVFKRVSHLLSEGRPHQALRLLQDALGSVDPKNLMAQRDVWAHIVSISLEAKDLKKAREGAYELYGLLERITALSSVAQAQSQEDLSRSIATIKLQKERLEEAFADIERRMRETGTPGGLTAAEKDEVREALKKARQEGKISSEEHDRVLKELGS